LHEALGNLEKSILNICEVAGISIDDLNNRGVIIVPKSFIDALSLLSKN